MITEPIDPAAIMADHAEHRRGQWATCPGVIGVIGDRCIPYALAAENAALREQLDTRSKQANAIGEQWSIAREHLTAAEAENAALRGQIQRVWDALVADERIYNVDKKSIEAALDGDQPKVSTEYAYDNWMDDPA